MSLILIIGPMFAGKTSELIRQIKLQTILNNNCIILKPLIDTRHEKNLVKTHDNISIQCFEFDFHKDYEEFDVIAIDEGQFIDNLYNFCLKWKHKKIIISALSGNFKREVFPSISDILPIATKIKHLRAICSCGDKAPFTKALGEFDIITIGGADKYKPCCGNCY